MNVLEELIGPKDISYFMTTHLRRHPFAKAHAAKKFENFFSWKILEEILPIHENSWLASGGRLPAEEELKTGRLSYAQAQKGFQNGLTVLIRNAEVSHARINSLAKSFKNAFQSRVDVQLYATPQKTEGFDWHYDVEDVFVIQSCGEKEFRLLPNTVTPRPLPLMTKNNCRFFEEKKSPEIRCWLKAGDFLYIPAGYWHKAHAMTDSFHLSVGVLFNS